MTRDERLARLERHQEMAARSFNVLLEQLAELNLRMMFVMNWFKFGRAKAGGLVIDGKIQQEIQTLYEIYVEKGRADMLAFISEQQEAVATALAAELEQQQHEETASDDERAATGAGTAGDESPVAGVDTALS